MKELTRFDLDHSLPKTGFMFIFYKFDEGQFRGGLEKLNGIRVLYYDSLVSDLERLANPRGPLTKRQIDLAPVKYPTCPLTFSSERLLPHPETILITRPPQAGVTPNTVRMTEHEYSYYVRAIYNRRANRQIHQMLGYPDQYSHPPSIPGDLFLPEIVSEAQYWGAGLEHRLLLQLSDDLADQLDFTIRSSLLFCMLNRDLMERDFSRVWVDTD